MGAIAPSKKPAFSMRTGFLGQYLRQFLGFNDPGHGIVVSLHPCLPLSTLPPAPLPDTRQKRTKRAFKGFAIVCIAVQFVLILL